MFARKSDLVFNKNKTEAVGLAKKIGGVEVGFDVTCEEQVKKGIEDFIKRAGRIDAVVNCAGVAQKIKPLIDTSVEEFDGVFSTNVKGAYLSGMTARRSTK